MNKNRFDMEDIIDLLDYLGASKVCQPKGNKIQFTCTIHNEATPSAGINIDYVPEDSNDHLQVFNCFSCHAKGTIPTLVLRSLPDQFKSYNEVHKFLKERYDVDYSQYVPEKKPLKRYEDFYNTPATPRFEMPMSKLAPFKSGKTTYSYFFNRGFTTQDVREYMIGCDLVNETVTIPVFWEDKKLAGIIGRYIDPKRKKNERYHVYDFPKSNTLYPLDKYLPIEDTMIIVEGIFDCIMLRKWGYLNAISIMGNGCSKKQADMIVRRCKKVITLFDNDSGGNTGRDSVEKLLDKKVAVFHPTWYPEYGKDPCEWGREHTINVIESAKYCNIRTIKRYN